VLLLTFTFTPAAYASSGIVSGYAWGNDASWINFAPASSTVTVSDASLSGYAWSENDGWINFSPTIGGVTNSNGTLSGWAWDQGAGWISFSGVSIDSSGTFHGEAIGSEGYAINFNCPFCAVETTWRPESNTLQAVEHSAGSIGTFPQGQAPPQTAVTLQTSNSATEAGIANQQMALTQSIIKSIGRPLTLPTRTDTQTSPLPAASSSTMRIFANSRTTRALVRRIAGALGIIFTVATLVCYCLPLFD
jgi:hypothetical protein